MSNEINLTRKEDWEGREVAGEEVKLAFEVEVGGGRIHALINSQLTRDGWGYVYDIRFVAYDDNDDLQMVRDRVSYHTPPGSRGPGHNANKSKRQRTAVSRAKGKLMDKLEDAEEMQAVLEDLDTA